MMKTNVVSVLVYSTQVSEGFLEYMLLAWDLSYACGGSGSFASIQDVRISPKFSVEKYVELTSDQFRSYRGCLCPKRTEL
jgi:hypothetical protein